MSNIEQIKERLDIVSQIGELVPLRKVGRNYAGFCPFHPNSRTPAFTVFPETQSYHCFSCKKSGDIFTFLMDREGLDFGEALERLAAQAGVALQPRSEREEREDAGRGRLQEINAMAATFYSHLLRASPRGEAARRYVEQRGLSQQTIETFHLGYAPAGWSTLLAYLGERGVEPEEAEAAGLAIRREDGGYYDRFRDRLLFPIHDNKGRVVGFGGRLLSDGHPKYLNSPQTPIFDKGSLLYGFYQAREAIRREDRVVVVEGYIDVLAAHQAGFHNVVAPMGTALSDSHVRTLGKLTKRIYLALDADAAGQTATLKGLQTLQENLETRTVPVPTSEGLRWERELDAEVRLLALPPGRDPDEVISEDPHRWQRLVNEAQPLMDFYFKALSAGLDLQSAKGRATAVERLVPLLAQIGDPIEQAHYIQQLATLIGMDEPLVRAQVMAARRRRGTASQPNIQTSVVNEREQEDYLLGLLLRYPTHRTALEQELAAEIAQKPLLKELLDGRISELFESTENRQVWLAFEQALADESAHEGAWVSRLPLELQQHVEQLLRRHQEPPLPPYRVGATLISCAQPLRLRLMRRWFNRLAEIIRSAAGEEQYSLLAQPNELLEHLHRLSRPPRSSYYRDLRDLPGL